MELLIGRARLLPSPGFRASTAQEAPGSAGASPYLADAGMNRTEALFHPASYLPNPVENGTMRTKMRNGNVGGPDTARVTASDNWLQLGPR